VNSPKNQSNDPHTAAVAKYEYAASLIVEKKWGSHTYMISGKESAIAVENHYGAKVSRHLQSKTSFPAMTALIVRELSLFQPLKLHIKGAKGYRHLVIDGYRIKHGKFFVHLNVGHSGYDNDWYEFGTPICLRHCTNGTTPTDGTCAYYYDDVNAFQVWSISVPKGHHIH